MKKNILKAINWFTSALDNHSSGSSMRKWGALIAILVAAKITIIFTNITVLSTIVSIWLIFSLLCLAIITGSQLVMLKNGITTTTTTKETENKTETETIKVEEPTNKTQNENSTN